MTRRAWGWALSAVVVALPAAGCSSSADVTNSAGSQVPGATPAPATASAVAGAPSCRGFPPATGRGLPCLGPGPAVELAALPGPTVVSVWASWCQPCREELPVLQEFHEQGGSVLGVAAADTPDSAAALLQHLGVTYPSVQDTASATRLDIGWSGLPVNVIVIDGQVVYRFNRPITSVDQVRRAVGQASGKEG